MQVFNALSGTEIARVIMIEVNRALTDHPDFKPHVTMPQVKWRWTLEMEIYPRDPKELSIEVADIIRTEGHDVKGAKAKKITLSDSREVTHPDKTREETNQPLQSAQPMLRRGQLANAPVEVGRAAQGPEVPLLNRDR